MIIKSRMPFICMSCCCRCCERSEQQRPVFISTGDLIYEIDIEYNIVYN